LNHKGIKPDELELVEKIVAVNRVAKVIKGGRRFSFSAVVVVGNGNGYVGFGTGKANEVPEAIRKGVSHAKNNLVFVPREGSTIPFETEGKYAAGKVILRPASPGTGVIAGGPVRAIMELAGVKDILTKSMGSTNPLNIIKATLAALNKMAELQETSRMRKT
jgi:small subunit ribosomal protein S5